MKALSTKTALVAEPLEARRDYVKLLLHEAGVEQVFEVGSGRDAMKAFRAHRPLLTVLAMRFDDASGAEVLGQIRALDAERPVCMAASPGGDADIEDVLEAGADLYLDLETGTETLVERLRTLITEAEWSVSVESEPVRGVRDHEDQ
jgi:DNA-binding response OmpR family regulator